MLIRAYIFLKLSFYYSHGCTGCELQVTRIDQHLCIENRPDQQLINKLILACIICLSSCQASWSLFVGSVMVSTKTNEYNKRLRSVMYAYSTSVALGKTSKDVMFLFVDVRFRHIVSNKRLLCNGIESRPLARRAFTETCQSRVCTPCNLQINTSLLFSLWTLSFLFVKCARLWWQQRQAVNISILKNFSSDLLV